MFPSWAQWVPRGHARGASEFVFPSRGYALNPRGLFASLGVGLAFPGPSGCVFPPKTHALFATGLCAQRIRAYALCATEVRIMSLMSPTFGGRGRPRGWVWHPLATKGLQHARHSDPKAFACVYDTQAPGERRKAQESPGEPWRAQENLGEPGRAQESPGELRRAQESPGEPWRAQESPGEPIGKIKKFKE